MQKQKKIPKRVFFKGLFISAVFLLSFVTVLSVIQPVQPVLAKGEGKEVLRYRFESRIDNKWKDLSEFENDGTNHGVGLTTSKSGLGKAGYFYGEEQEDYIDCGNDQSLKLDTDDFTIALWVYLFDYDNPLGSCFFFSAGGDGGCEDWQMVNFGIWKYTNKLFIGFYGARWVSSVAVSLETWTHVAVTYDRSQDKVYFYKNGDFKQSAIMSGKPSFWGWSGAQVGRAYYPPYDGMYVDGYLDELNVYKKLLDATEIEALYNYSMLTNSEINTMIELGEDFIDSLYLDMGDYAYIAEYPALPIAVNNKAGGKADYIINDMDCKENIAFSVMNMSETFEAYNYTIYWGSDWIKLYVETFWRTDGTQRVYICYFGKSSGFNDNIDVWFWDTRIFDNICTKTPLVDEWYDDFGVADTTIGRIPAYRFAPRHMRQLAYKWYRNKGDMGKYWELKDSLDREGWKDNYDIYDAMFGQEFTYSYYWTETDDFNNIYLWWDAYKPLPRDIYEEIKENSTYYPWDTSGKGGTYPYKSGIVGFLIYWMVYWLQDPLKWGMEASHLFCRYGAENEQKRTTALNNLESCDFDGKGIEGGIQGWSPAYSAPRLAVWVAAASRWANAGYWAWDEVDQAAEILSQLQWSGEGWIYNDTSEDFEYYKRPSIKGGFICSYICSEPVYRSYRPWLLTAIMDYADRLGIEEQMSDEYIGIKIANFETSILSMLALQIYQYHRLS